MRGAGEKALRPVLVVLAVGHAAAAIGLLAAPAAVSGLIGGGEDVSAGLGWVVAALGLVALLAVVAARAPEREARAIGLLVVAEGLAVLAFARLLLLPSPPAGAARGLAIALLATLAVSTAFALQWASSRPGLATAALDRRTLQALLEAVLPVAGPDDRLPAPLDPELLGSLDRRLAGEAGPDPLARRLALRSLDAVAWRSDRQRFADLEAGARHRLIDQIEETRGWWARPAVELASATRRDLPFVFWEDERVLRAIGHDPEHVPSRIRLGPNAAAWRAREEVEQEAANAVARAAQAPEQAGDTTGREAGVSSEARAGAGDAPASGARAGAPAASESAWRIGSPAAEATDDGPRWTRDPAGPSPAGAPAPALPLRAVRTGRTPGRS